MSASHLARGSMRKFCEAVGSSVRDQLGLGLKLLDLQDIILL